MTGDETRGKTALASRLVDAVMLLGALAYLYVFLSRQAVGLDNPYLMEFDARAQALPAFRYHGTGLFSDDLGVDHYAVEALPLWKSIFWIGTLFTDPFTLTRWLPFPIFLLMLWHGFRLARHFGGVSVGAAAVVLLVHCNFLWDRVVGANPRAFGPPLVAAFLHYACLRHERRTLFVLLLMALGYPSAFLVCAPAYGLLLLPALLRRDWPPVRRFAMISLVCLGVGLWTSHPGPQFGRPVTPRDAAELREMAVMLPQPTTRAAVRGSLNLALGTVGKNRWPAFERWHRDHSAPLLWLLVFASLAVGGRALGPPLVVFAATFAASWLAFGVATLLLFRLYFPERLFQYSWPLLIPLGLVITVGAAFHRRWPRYGGPLAALLLCALFLTAYGDGLPGQLGMRDYRSVQTPVVRFAASLPKEVLIAARLSPAFHLQAWARRRLYITAGGNRAHFYAYAREMERRNQAFYQAYYAATFEPILAFAETERVSLLVVDENDFKPSALAGPWKDMGYSEVAKRLLSEGLQRGHFALAAPPAAAIVFRDGSTYVLDLRKVRAALRDTQAQPSPSP